MNNYRVFTITVSAMNTVDMVGLVMDYSKKDEAIAEAKKPAAAGRNKIVVDFSDPFMDPQLQALGKIINVNGHNI